MATGIERPKIAILASGSGTTAEHVVHATQTGALRADVGLLVTNNYNSPALGRIARLRKQYGLDISRQVVDKLTYPGGPGEPHEQTLQESEVIADLCAGFDLIVLLGYMRKVRGPLLDLPVVNTHPGLLPATQGKHGKGVQGFVLEQGHQYTGQTLHEVDEEYDHGLIIAEHKVPVMPLDTMESLSAAVQATEKVWLPVDLNNLLHH